MRVTLMFLICAVGVLFSAGETVTFDVPEGTVSNYGDPLGAEVTNVVKTGSGRLVLTAASPSFTGTIQIREGVLEPGIVGALGHDNTVVISDGAGLEATLIGLSQLTPIFQTTRIFAEGAGPNGDGAIQYNPASDVNPDFLFGPLTLTGDLVLGGKKGRFGFGGMTIDMAGHDLIYDGEQKMIFSARFVNPGNIISKCVDLVFQGATTYEGSTENVLALCRANGKLSFWDAQISCPWTIDVRTNAILQSGAGNAGSKNRWPGPVKIAKGQTLTLTTYTYTTGAYTSLSLLGPVSGEGGLAVRDSSRGGIIVSLANPSNTYSGGTSIEGGTVWASADASVPPAGPVKVTSGVLNLVMSPTNWLAASAHTLLEHTTASTELTPLLYTETNTVFEDTVSVTNAITLRHGGPGTYIYNGSLTGLPTLANQSGTMIVTGGGVNEVGNFACEGGVLRLEDAGLFDMTNRYITVGTTTSNTFPRLILAGRTVLTGVVYPEQKGGPEFKIGVKNTPGAILEMESGAVLTNRVQMGDLSSVRSAFYQRGGSFYNSSCAGNDGRWGADGYAHYELTGGTAEIRGWLGLGTLHGGYGIATLKGGTFTDIGTTLCLGRGGRGEIYQTDGVFKAMKPVKLGEIQWGDKKPGGFSVLTIDGPSARAEINSYTELGERSNAVALVNLKSGTFSTPYFQKNNLSTNSEAHIGFNGGTFRAMESRGVFVTGRLAADSVTVYDGGAVVDTDGKNLSFALPLVRPSGKSILSIALPANLPRTAYLGPSPITITGVGHAASALTDFDSVNNTISSVIVTSPGFGYDDETTATVRDNLYQQDYPCEVTLTEQTGGGLTKIGDGTLTLKAVNTWAGATVVSNGTLTAGIDGALPTGNALVVSGGATLNLGGFGVTTTNLLVAGEIINGDVAVSNTLTVSAPALRAGHVGSLTGRLTIAPGTELTVSAPDMLDDSGRSYLICTAAGGIDGLPILPPNTLESPYWRVLKPNAATLVLSCQRGSVMMFR